jgi:hypothetical protein
MGSWCVAILQLPDPERLARAQAFVASAPAISALVEDEELEVAWIDLFMGVSTGDSDRVRDWVLTGMGPMPSIEVPQSDALSTWQGIRAYAKRMGDE